MANGTAQFIKIKTKGKVYDVAFQQYEIGLYVCFYHGGRMVDQFGLDSTQEEFVKKMKDDTNIEILEQ